MNTFIEEIRISLTNKLPGKVAQYKMAPSDRAIRDQALNIVDLRKSAVLIVLFVENNELCLLLTQRANYKGPHGGQISFPGGKFEINKDRSLQDTALRETLEEVNISLDNIEVLGPLSTLNIPISKISVQPFVAFCKDLSMLKPDGFEIVDTYKIPLSFFENKENVKLWEDSNIAYPYYDFKEKRIWGATAMMISEFMALIKSSNKYSY